jgi:F-type H+-transporting ATPase subunit b
VELLELLSASQILAQIVSFLLLLAVMRAFVWKKFLKILDDRKERVYSEYNRLEAAKSAVEDIKAEYEAKVASMDAVAQAKIGEAVAEGERIAKEIMERSRLEAEKAGIDAREVIDAEIKKAREDLRKDIVDIAISVAEKVIAEKITDADDRKLVEEFVRKAEAMR